MHHRTHLLWQLIFISVQHHLWFLLDISIFLWFSYHSGFELWYNTPKVNYLSQYKKADMICISRVQCTHVLPFSSLTHQHSSLCLAVIFLCYIFSCRATLYLVLSVRLSVPNFCPTFLSQIFKRGSATPAWFGLVLSECACHNGYIPHKWQYISPQTDSITPCHNRHIPP